jgi:hypothetical protein
MQAREATTGNQRDEKPDAAKRERGARLRVGFVPFLVQHPAQHGNHHREQK